MAPNSEVCCSFRAINPSKTSIPIIVKHTTDIKTGSALGNKKIKPTVEHNLIKVIQLGNNLKLGPLVL
jgi:hypothetical protein